MILLALWAISLYRYHTAKALVEWFVRAERSLVIVVPFHTWYQNELLLKRTACPLNANMTHCSTLTTILMETITVDQNQMFRQELHFSLQLWTSISNCKRSEALSMVSEISCPGGRAGGRTVGRPRDFFLSVIASEAKPLVGRPWICCPGGRPANRPAGRPAALFCFCVMVKQNEKHIKNLEF